MRPVLYLVLGFVSIVEAAPQQGSCVGFSFPLHSDNKTVDSLHALKVLRHEAEVYQDASSATGVTRLPFSEPVEPVAVSEARDRGRIQIKKVGDKDALGWMKREDLLCSKRPLLDDKKILERKLFIKTPPAKVGTAEAVPAYPFPQGTECTSRCKKLSRFELYFIFAEDPDSKRYLIAEQYQLDDSTPLVGWVDRDAGIPWNTVLGLRPSDKEGVQIRIAPSLKEASEHKGTVILGGKDWYKYPMHIPILGLSEDQKYFHIAAPGVGARAEDGTSGPKESEDLKQAFEGFPALKALEGLKEVDIFFLLDGTLSMGPYIQNARASALTIVDTFSKTANYKESYARFGFRMYRDDFAGNRGVGEGLDLPTDCSPSRESMQTNRDKFAKELTGVKVSLQDQVINDGYPENLFHGLRQAVRDMASCPQRRKLLFVIGDAGDNEVRVPEDVIKQLRAFSKPVIPFFIRTTNDEQRARNPQAYRVSYDRFKDQALTVLDQILPQHGLDNKPIPRRDHFRDGLGAQDVVNEILKSVKQYAPSDTVNELLVALRGGQALENYIRARMAEGDLPVLYWELVRETVCEELGKQCREQIDHRVTTGYTAISEEWVQELWISSVDIDKWLVFLKQIIEFMDSMGTRLSEQKDRLATLLAEKVQQLVGQPPIKESGETLEQYVKRKGGLPSPSFSPLLQYDLREIREMESCELRRLGPWIRSMRDILTQVRADGTLQPMFTRADYPGEQCPSASDKGKKIPRIEVQSSAKLGKDDTKYRYDHAFRNEVRYWLPEGFFP